MNIINVNGRVETVSDIHEGIDLARDVMGEDWYSFMRQEVFDVEETWDVLEEEIQEYKDSEENLIQDYQGYLLEVQDLVEEAIKLLGEMKTSRKIREAEKFLDEARRICFKNT